MPIYVPTKLGSYYIYAAAKNDQWGEASPPLRVGMIRASCDGDEKVRVAVSQGVKQPGNGPDKEVPVLLRREYLRSPQPRKEINRTVMIISLLI